MRRSRAGALTALVLVLLMSTSCGTRTDSSGDSATPRLSAPGTDRTGCERVVAFFAVSFVRDGGGQATPLAAVMHFGDPGYQAPAHEWVSVPSPTDSEGQDVEGVTLRTDHVYLHVVHFTDGTWAVDNGGHCAAATRSDG